MRAGDQGISILDAASMNETILLRGESVTLPAGVYAFIDGNHLGGVGVVFVMQRDGREPVVKEIARR